MSEQQARAVVETDWMRDGIRVAARLNEHTYVAGWGSNLTLARVQEPDRATELSDENWLNLPTDLARAIYEALADHFGHSGHDTRALRRDYDSERGRVDKMIEALIGTKP